MRVAIKSYNGQYVSARTDEPNTPLRAMRPDAGPWEQFELEILGGPPVVPTIDPAAALGPLTVDGTNFRDPAGVVWYWRGATDFKLFRQYLDDQDITARLRERKALGANLVRVLGMARNLFTLSPSTIGEAYYVALPSFLALVAEEGLRCEFVALADAQVQMPGLADQQRHVARVAELLAGTTHLGELVNEYQSNGVDPTQFMQPAGVWSRGSFVDGQIPSWTGWSHHTWHGRRVGYKTLLSSADPLLELHLGVDWAATLGKRPAVQNEPVKFTSQCADPAVAYVIGVTSTLYGNGATFHSDEGLQSDPYHDDTHVCGEAFFRGLTVGAQR